MPPLLAAVPVIISGVIAGSTTAAIVEGSVLAIAAAEGTSLLQQSLRKGSSGGVRTNITIDPTVSRALLTGRVYTAGSAIGDPYIHDHWPTGTKSDQGKNRTAESLIDLADHECDGLEQIYVNGELVTLGTYDATMGWPILKAIDPTTGTFETPDGRATTDYTGKLYVQFHSGADDQAADAWLLTIPGTPFASTDVGTNVCYARASMRYDADVFSGLPEFNFVLRGARLYDPRKDSTVPGGSGSHRFGTPSTYEWTANTAVRAYNIARGISVGGSPFYGLFAPSARVPLDSAMAAMNACDEAVALKAGGTQARYEGGAETPLTQEVRQTLKALADEMGGRIATDGDINIYAGVTQTPIFSFTDGDLIADAPRSYDDKASIGALYNSIFATYLDPTQQWTMVSAPPRSSDADIALDAGYELRDTLQLDSIQSNSRCQRIMEIFRKRARAQATATRTFGPAALNARVGQWVEGASVDWGYSNKFFEITKRSVVASKGQGNVHVLNVTLTLREVPDNLDAWTASTDELDSFDANLPSDAPPTPLPPEDYGITPLSLTGADGSTIPAVHVTWTNPNDPRVTNVLVEYQQNGGASQFAFGLPEDELVRIAEGLLSGAVFSSRLAFQLIGSLEPIWTDWRTETLAVATFPGGIDPLSVALLKALSPSASIRSTVANQVYLPWLDTLEQFGASTAAAIAGLQTTNGVLIDAGITRDPATGIVTISAVNAVKTDLDNYKTTVTATFDAVNAQIDLRVTQTDLNSGLAAAAAGFSPTAVWSFNTDTNGWTASNATIASTAGVLVYTGTGASPYLQSPATSIDAASNPIVQIKAQRVSGASNGAATLSWGAGYASSQVFAVPTDPAQSNLLQADLTGNADWTGTITAFRIAIGDASSVFDIQYVSVGAMPLQAVIVGGLTTRVTELESSVTLLGNQIALTATQAEFDDLAATVTSAQITIAANTASIGLKASQADLDSTNASLETAQSQINAQSGIIDQVLSFTSGATAVGPSATPEQVAVNIAAAMAGLIQTLDQVKADLAYARQGLYLDLKSEAALRISAVSQLTVQIGNSTSNLLAVQTATATALTAEVSARVAGEASILNVFGPGFDANNTVAAAFTAEQIARVSAEGALASSVNIVQAALTGFDGATTVASVTNAQQAQITTLNGTLSTVASNLSTVTTTVGSHTASISTLTSSVNGLKGQWGVEIDVNGNAVALAKLDGSATSSAFTIVASDFKLYDPHNGAYPMFAITGGQAYFNVPLVAGLVTAGVLAAGAVATGTVIADNIILRNHLVLGAANAAAQGSTLSGTLGTTFADFGTISAAYTPGDRSIRFKCFFMLGGDPGSQVTLQATISGGILNGKTVNTIWNPVSGSVGTQFFTEFLNFSTISETLSVDFKVKLGSGSESIIGAAYLEQPVR